MTLGHLAAAVRIFALTLAIVAVTSATSSFATTIGFEEVVPAAGYVNGLASYTEGGFTLTDNDQQSWIFDSAVPLVVNNGTDVFGWQQECNSVCPVVLTLTENGGGAFSLISFEVGNMDLGNGVNPGEQIVITGHLSGGGTVVQTFDLVAETLSFVALGAGFTNLTSVEFTGLLPGFRDLQGGGGSGDAGLSSLVFDNIVVNVVPEPTTASLLGLGLIGVAVGRKRSETCANRAVSGPARMSPVPSILRT